MRIALKEKEIKEQQGKIERLIEEQQNIIEQNVRRLNNEFISQKTSFIVSLVVYGAASTLCLVVKWHIIFKILLLFGVLVITYSVVRLIEKSSKKEQKTIQMTGFSDFRNFVEFLLEEEKEGNIILGQRKEQKKDRFFVGFYNEQINGFLGEWFEMLRLCSKISHKSEMYDIWVKDKKKKLL